MLRYAEELTLICAVGNPVATEMPLVACSTRPAECEQYQA
jgi:hypothetical protein